MIARRLEEQDLQLRVTWMNNPIVSNNMHFETPVMMENTIKWFQGNIGNEKRVDLVFEEEGRIVAFGGLTRINREINKAELYIFVNPESQKVGIGTRATKILCKYGFEKLGLNKIHLETNEDNKAAQNVYKKCGFKLEGILREEYCTNNGHMLSRMYYGLLRGELNE
ncbi:GNAT family N-acetyltransferase [Porphyromonas loveana]|uniref:Diamine N-acetyltransferase n=1 Tax=Porphyromonas loveana TaxID=1884669 RepID=A0A2U1FPL0_9PORP|nr:GNAT family protein [Porphyromonas loveana]PVZ14108.1 diamine N-acetyltransferase [Porphyromonas loveana]